MAEPTAYAIVAVWENKVRYLALKHTGQHQNRKTIFKEKRANFYGMQMKKRVVKRAEGNLLRNMGNFHRFAGRGGQHTIVRRL